MEEFTRHPIEWLARSCHSSLLDTKWLLTERMAIGQLYKDRLNLAGNSTINLHCQTMRTIGLALSSSMIAELGFSVASPSITRMLLRTVFEDLLKLGELSYFNQSKSVGSLSMLLERSIMDLRLAMVAPNELDKRDFESTEKCDDLVKIYWNYLDALKKSHLLDYADCLHLIINGLREGTCRPPEDLKLLLPDQIAFTALEKQMVAALKQRSEFFERLPPDDNENLNEVANIQSQSQLPRISFVSAVGEVNEVRATFQNILSREHDDPVLLDQCELVYTDAGTYLPLIAEQLSLWMTELQAPTESPPPVDQLPMTITEGLPCIYSRPGRALRSWMRWVGTDFLQTRAVQMVREGLLNRPVANDGEQSIGYSRLASSLRAIPIGFGVQRYLPKIADAIRDARNRIAEYTHSGDKEEDLTQVDRKRDFGLSTLLSVEAIIAPIVQLAPEESDSFEATIKKAKQFLLSCVRADNRLDRLARNQLLEDMDSMLAATNVTTLTTLDVRQWLEDLPVESRILAGGPMPGKIHITPLAFGGFSGRKNAFILGLDDGRFPGKVRLDPVLLDAERERISPDLEVSLQKQARTEKTLIQTIVRMSECSDKHVVASYSVRSLSDHRQLFPSTAMLDIFRIARDLPNAQLPDLLTHIGSPKSFASRAHEDCISPSDELISQLMDVDEPSQQKEMVTERFVHAKWQQLAYSAQDADALSAYDGLIPEASSVMNLCKIERVSSSRLESYGACPRRYFFQRGIEVYPPDEWTFDLNGWLEPMQVGNLIHALFEEFLRDLSAVGKYPVLERDRDFLLEMLHRDIAKLVDDFPVVNQDAFHRQCRDLEDMCEIFLAAEEEHCLKTGARPWVLEASIGLEGEENSIIDCPEPVPFTLSDGRRIMLCGRIDRIDRIQTAGSDRYVIWDYKTGSDFGYHQDKPLRQGRKLQPFLYIGMLRHRIESLQQNDDTVEAFGYFFPSRKTNGKRLQWRRVQLNAGDEVLRQICDAIERGLFPATTDKNDCGFCDYRNVCCDVEWVTETSRRKASEACNVELLAPWRALRELE